MGTIIVGLIVLGIAGLAVRSMVRNRKKRKEAECGGDCGKCGGCFSQNR